jgi:hypothetical protein
MLRKGLTVGALLSQSILALLVSQQTRPEAILDLHLQTSTTLRQGCTASISIKSMMSSM